MTLLLCICVSCLIIVVWARNKPVMRYFTSGMAKDRFGLFSPLICVDVGPA